jgi:hypothetical protein
MDNFSFVEMLLIRQLVTKNDADEIAVIMEKPVEDIRVYIHANALLTRPKKLIKKRVSRKPNKEQIERERRREIKIALQRQQKKNEQERAIRRRQPEFKTKEVDYNKMISVRVDHKTVLQVPAGTDIEALKKKYFQRHKDSKVEATHFKVVKKFKP